MDEGNSRLDKIDLTKIDLNLLTVLDVLLRERSVAVTADTLNLTPSAISHALRRLRALFGNELLVRDGRKMYPTARAEQLAETLPAVLRQLERVLAEPEPFDPARSDRVFRLVAPDFISTLIPQLLNETGKTAPGIRIDLKPFASEAAQDLIDGHYDAMIAPSTVKRDGLKAAPLGRWPWAVYGRSGHPAFEDWSIESWSSFPHLQIRTSVQSGQGPVDSYLAQHGVSRSIGAVVPHFSMAPQILAQTDLLLTVPSIAMINSASAHNLEFRRVPFELPELQLSLISSARFGDEPGVRWFVEQIEAAFGQLGKSIR